MNELVMRVFPRCFQRFKDERLFLGCFSFPCPYVSDTPISNCMDRIAPTITTILFRYFAVFGILDGLVIEHCIRTRRYESCFQT